MDILFLIALGFALKAGFDWARRGAADSRSARLKDIKAKHPRISKTRRSAMMRRHTAGYWAGETLKGFPEARHGIAAGWHAHRTAAEEARLARLAAAANHEETRASIREQAGVHRRRMAIALEEQRRTTEREAQEAERERQKAEGKTPSPPLRAVPDLPQTPAVTEWPPVRTGPPAAEGMPEGSPEPPEAAAPPVPPSGTPPAASGPEPSPATEGAPLVATSETTYTEDLAEANAIVSEAEQHLADLERRRWADRMEALASAGLDSDTLSKAADLNDSIGRQIEEAKKTIEHATAFRDGLVRKHEAGHEYHSTTQGGGAEKSYLADR